MMQFFAAWAAGVENPTEERMRQAHTAFTTLIGARASNRREMPVEGMARYVSLSGTIPGPSGQPRDWQAISGFNPKGMLFGAMGAWGSGGRNPQLIIMVTARINREIESTNW